MGSQEFSFFTDITIGKLEELGQFYRIVSRLIYIQSGALAVISVLYNGKCYFLFFLLSEFDLRLVILIVLAQK